MAPQAGIDPRNLSEAGWGVIFAHGEDPAIREALKELLAHRKGQAGGQRASCYKEYAGFSAFRRGDTTRTFLARNGAAAGMPANPRTVPYYLLIVADPETIPYSFQFQLGVGYAVGRLWFETDDKPDLEAFARYARTVTEAERSPPNLVPRAVLYGVCHPGDPPTELATQRLVVPLGQRLAEPDSPWRVEVVLGGEATKARLARHVGGPDTPALLFTVSHGLVFPSGTARQRLHQGALVCGDWPGPGQVRGPVPPQCYFAGEDLSDSGRLKGLIAFHLASHSAGTPGEDDFAAQTPDQRPTVAPHAFVARLPQRLLSHPDGGALAVVGYADRVWSYSLSNDALASHQLEAFESTLLALGRGDPLGHAVQFVTYLYAEVSTELNEELNDISYGKRIDDERLAGLWSAYRDARNLVILGDPAVRLPF